MCFSSCCCWVCVCVCVVGDVVDVVDDVVDIEACVKRLMNVSVCDKIYY